LISAVVVSVILGVICELLRFIKWYVSIKHRVTTNSLNQLINETKVEELNAGQKSMIITLFILHRGI
jgi:hypothetical protein